MPGGNMVDAERQEPAVEFAELDPGIAYDTWIGREPAAILIHEVRHN